MLGKQSQEGNVYDVETGKYDPASNKEGTDETISNNGIDQLLTDEEQTVGSFDAIICVDGKPFNATINGSIGDEIT
jgi:N12 class adenine-specific DNA methylase